jgi:hypothetical protein
MKSDGLWDIEVRQDDKVVNYALKEGDNIALPT